MRLKSLLRTWSTWSAYHLRHLSGWKFYAPINVNPQGGGRGDPGKFDIFTRARVKFPTPEHLENVKFQPLGTAFCPKQFVGMSNSRPLGQNPNVKIPTQEKARQVNYQLVTRAPTPTPYFWAQH